VLEAAGMEADRFEGEMIDCPVIERAKGILARVTHQG
jgi:citrate lyase beta subunit